MTYFITFLVSTQMRVFLGIAAAAALALSSPISQFPFAVEKSELNLASIPEVAALSQEHLVRLSEHVRSLPDIRTIRFASGEEIEMTEGEKSLLTLQSIRYMDVTDEETYFTTQAKQSFPANVTYSANKLQSLFDHLSQSRAKEFLTKFSSYYTRYYRSPTGASSQKFLLQCLTEIAASNPKLNVTIVEFEHAWGQNSIIARFPGTDSVSATAPVVILGGHLDSTNLLPFLSAPGAGDDGSGTTTLVEAFHALVNATFIPSTNPVEFHWYSAEEGGLLGSQAVAQSYAKLGIAVRAMQQLDMTSWVKTGTKPVMGIIRDFVDPDFTEFIVKVVVEYAEIDAVDTKCGYACSDHASWTKIGVPSAFAIESRFEDSNKKCVYSLAGYGKTLTTIVISSIHSSSDKLDISPEFSFEHMMQFSRMSIALAVELGGGDSLA